MPIKSIAMGITSIMALVSFPAFAQQQPSPEVQQLVADGQTLYNAVGHVVQSTNAALKAKDDQIAALQKQLEEAKAAAADKEKAKP